MYLKIKKHTLIGKRTKIFKLKIFIFHIRDGIVVENPYV